MTARFPSRRGFLAGAVGAVLSGVGCTRSSVLKNEPETTAPPRKSELEVANEKFLNRDYRGALSAYETVARVRPELANDLKYSIALCHERLGTFDAAYGILRDAKPETSDDTMFLALMAARTGHPEEAQRSADALPKEDLLGDVELLEALTLAAAKAGDRPAAWRWFRMIETHHPSSPAIDRLNQAGASDFTADFYGHGVSDLLNYGRGFKSGVWGWTVDMFSGMWQMIRHPIRTAEEAARGIADLCKWDNIKLLTSPRDLGAALGDVAAHFFWSAWEACKTSAVREYNLDPEKYEDQRAIHEIAAGRMFGYVAPDLVLLVLPVAGPASKVLEGGKALEMANAASKAERAAEAAKLVGQAEQRLEQVNMVARSARFAEDAKQLPRLRALHWLTDSAWETLRSSERIASRLEEVVEWMHEVRHVPGAERLVAELTANARLGPKVEGYLYQLRRAAAYAKRGELSEVGKRFTVRVIEPGKPVRWMKGEADLFLRDGTLVETKFRSGPLALDETLHKQLLKYKFAARDGQFQRVRLECSGTIAAKVREGCDLLRSEGVPIELFENVNAGP